MYTKKTARHLGILDPLKAHRFNVNEQSWCLHTVKEIHEGMKVYIGEFSGTVKKIVRSRESIYYQNHNYYEIEVL